MRVTQFSIWGRGPHSQSKNCVNGRVILLGRASKPIGGLVKSGKNNIIAFRNTKSQNHRKNPLCYNWPMNSTPSIPVPISPTSSNRFPYLTPWLLPLLGSFLLLILFGTHRLNDSDVGFHLRTGQWILQNHRFPNIDTYTYTVAGHEYLDMESLYQVSLYLLYRLGGYECLSLSHILLAIAAFFLVWIRLREKSTPFGLCVLLFAAAVLASETRIRVRPEVLSWVLLGLTLLILEWRTTAKKDLLFLLPLIQWIWVNTEGLFFIGWAVMGFYALSGLSPSSKTDRKLLKYFFLSLALCLMNPHFIRGFLFPFSFLGTLGSSEIYKFMAKEFQPPWSIHDPSSWVPALYLFAYKTFSLFLLALLAATFRRRKIREWLLVVFFFGLSVVAVRNIPLFMISSVPLATVCWTDLEWPWLQKLQDRFIALPFTAWVLALFLLGFGLRVLTNAHYVSDRLSDRFGLGLDQETLPVRACQFLAQNHLDGRIINTLDAGDWLDWQGPQKTFMDGRLDVMGGEFLGEYSASLGEAGPQALIEKYKPDIFFFNPLYAMQWIVYLNQSPDWRLVYLDECTALYLRKSYMDQITGLDYDRLLAERGLSKTIISQAPSLLSATPASDLSCFGRDFYEPSTYSNGLLNLGIFTTYTGHPEVAETCLLEGIQRTQGRYYDYYYNLGCLYYYGKRYNEALTCMRRVLRDRPQNPVALQMVQSLSPQ